MSFTRYLPHLLICQRLKVQQKSCQMALNGTLKIQKDTWIKAAIFPRALITAPEHISLKNLLFCQKLKVSIINSCQKPRIKKIWVNIKESYLNKSSNISKGVDYSPRTFLIPTFSIACNLMGSFGSISCWAAIFNDFLEFFHDIHVHRVIANSWYNNATWKKEVIKLKSKFELISPELYHFLASNQDFAQYKWSILSNSIQKDIKPSFLYWKTKMAKELSLGRV